MPVLNKPTIWIVHFDEVFPHPLNPEFVIVRDAALNCFINTDSAESAKARAIAYLYENYWDYDLAELEDPDNQAEILEYHPQAEWLESYLAAVEDGESYFFYVSYYDGVERPE